MLEKKVLINGLEVGYKIEESKNASLPPGRQVLILHGWGSSAEKWQKVAELLAENGLRVIIPDLPGFGSSPKPSYPWGLNEYCEFVEKFVDSFNLDKFFLLGHSFGGALAIKYSLKFPKKIEKLFLVASACIRTKTKKKQFLSFLSRILKVFSFLPFYSLARRAFYKFVVRKSDYVYLNGVMKESYLKVIQEDLSNSLYLVKVPTIIIWGEKDDATPLKDAYFINEKIRNSELEIIKNEDHDLERKAPGILADKIIKNIK